MALTHRTEYRYDRAVTRGPQTIRLRPAPHARIPVLAYSLTVAPKPHFLNWQQDPQGNFLARVVFPERVTGFSVTVDLVADMATINPFDFFLEPDAESWPFTYDPVLVNELAPFRRTDPLGPRLTALLAEVPRSPLRNIDKLVALNRMVATAPPISCAWSRGSGRRRRRWRPGAVPAAIPPGCWCNCCTSSATPLASPPAT